MTCEEALDLGTPKPSFCPDFVARPNSNQHHQQIRYKIMSAPSVLRPSAPPRRKACDACASAKVRCDRSATCARCLARGLNCQYPSRSHTQAAVQHPEPIDHFNESPCSGGHVSESVSASTISYTLQSPSVSNRLSPVPQASTLICGDIDASAIRNRWLKPYLTDDNDQRKSLPPSTTVYIREVLRSYVSMVASDCRLPPFIHHSQVSGDFTSLPLSNCFGLLRVLSVRAAVSTEFTSDLLTREMSSIQDKHATYDDKTLLGAFQAYLLYSMALYFRCGQTVLPDNVTTLQQLASMTISQGATMTTQPWSSPDWNLWVLAEAKRRTTLTMYLFDNLLCATDDLPMFVATELSGMSAPAPRSLWDAASLVVWQRDYNAYLDACDGVVLQINELWSSPPGFSADQARRRRERVGAWLQRVDEYGTMLFAVTTSTHGS